MAFRTYETVLPYTYQGYMWEATTYHVILQGYHIYTVQFSDTYIYKDITKYAASTLYHVIVMQSSSLCKKRATAYVLSWTGLRVILSPHLLNLSWPAVSQIWALTILFVHADAARGETDADGGLEFETHRGWIWTRGWIFRRRSRQSAPPWRGNCSRRPLCKPPSF